MRIQTKKRGYLTADHPTLRGLRIARFGRMNSIEAHENTYIDTSPPGSPALTHRATEGHADTYPQASTAVFILTKPLEVAKFLNVKIQHAL